MSSRSMRGWLVLALLAVITTVGAFSTSGAQQQEELTRKVKTKVAPSYPEIARRMNLSGTVKLEVVVAPNGSVKSTKIIGGHPLLASSAIDAVKKWRFEPASDETTGIVEFKFDGAGQ
ncbi:MAG TPA: energy transducer TonB [Terriglobales bacterium]|nr:energy transducer TonB [Terriglobales bacterium]